MVFLQAILRSKANTTELYGNMFTSEIDIQHVKVDVYKVHYLFER